MLRAISRYLPEPQVFDPARYGARGYATEALATAGSDQLVALQTCWAAAEAYATAGGKAVIPLSGFYLLGNLNTRVGSPLVMAPTASGGSVTFLSYENSATFICTWDRTSADDAVLIFGTEDHSVAPMAAPGGFEVKCIGTFATRKDPVLVRYLRIAQSDFRDVKLGSCNNTAQECVRGQNVDLTGFSASGGMSWRYKAMQPGTSDNVLVRQTGNTVDIVGGASKATAADVGKTLTLTTSGVGEHRQTRIIGYTDSTTWTVDTTVTDMEDMRAWFGSPAVTTRGDSVRVFLDGTDEVTLDTGYTTANIQAGDMIECTGVPDGTTVDEVIDATHLRMTAAATTDTGSSTELMVAGSPVITVDGDGPFTANAAYMRMAVKFDGGSPNSAVWICHVEEYLSATSVRLSRPMPYTTSGINTYGTVTAGSLVVTGIPDTTGMSAGQTVAGRGLYGNTIDTVDSGTQITLAGVQPEVGGSNTHLLVNGITAKIATPVHIIRNRLTGEGSSSDVRIWNINWANGAGVTLAAYDTNTIYATMAKFTSLTTSTMNDTRFTEAHIWAQAVSGVFVVEHQDQPLGDERFYITKESSRVAIMAGRVRLSEFGVFMRAGPRNDGTEGGVGVILEASFSGTRSGFETKHDLYRDPYNPPSAPGIIFAGPTTAVPHNVARFDALGASFRLDGSADLYRGYFRAKNNQLWSIRPDGGSGGDFVIYNETTGTVVFRITAAGNLITSTVSPLLPTYTVATVPSASTYARAMIYVSDETGGAVPAFSDGTNWRRVTDRAVVS